MQIEETGAMREQHHRRILDALTFLELKVERLRDLSYEIQGTDIPPGNIVGSDKAAELHSVSLADTLENSAGQIRRSAEGIDELVDQIRSMLF